ncbi:MAG: carbon-nitrogen hydrolase family protein [Epsilonproteobacteria bacterium]|nr:carbon-nitrogen hydrolase family protein [Campylobacterota bacterium]
MKIAIYQSDALPIDKAKINYHLALARREGAKLFLIPEYVLNRFFKELEKMPISFIKNQTQKQIEILKRNSNDITILAPLILIKGDKKYKVIGKFFKGKVRYYYSQVNMPYSHWNEEKFFDTKENNPMVFSLGKYRIGALFGFESHFDNFWSFFRKKRVDFVAVLSVGTFDSFNRWYCMLKSRAFLNNMYVCRVNRVGEFKDWKFYGRSFVINPEGDDLLMLGENEEVGIFSISKDVVKEASKEWKFKQLYSKISSIS